MSTEPRPSVGIVSLGCAKNLVDTQVMVGVLLTEGFAAAPRPERADVLLVNTCAFIGPARREAAAAIREACALKRAGHCRAVIVAGCLPQRYGRRLRRRFPAVDAWLGVDHLEDVAVVARRALGPRRRRAAPVAVTTPPAALFTPRLPALVLSGGPFAYLKIAEGCDHACTFCAIPAIRGHLRSRPLAALAAEARALLGAGAREIDIIAQDTTAYGRERRGAPRLAQLLRELDGIEGRFWLRLLYGHPAGVDGELLAAMAESRHLLRYLDLPVQHSHPAILRAMGRADTIAALPGLTERLRAALPGVTLRTTCLTGFPGETEEHFRHLLGYVAAARFDHLGVFVFSPEEGTPAARLPRRVPPAVAEERRARLMLRQQAVVRELNRARIGTTAELLLLRPAAGGGGRWLARAPWQAPEVDGLTRLAGAPAGARTGDFRRARIVGFRGCDLRAEDVGEA